MEKPPLILTHFSTGENLTFVRQISPLEVEVLDQNGKNFRCSSSELEYHVTEFIDKLIEFTTVPYTCGEYQGVIDRCPKGKVIYTLVDGDGTSCHIYSGLHMVNRLEVYYGDDLGLPHGVEIIKI